VNASPRLTKIILVTSVYAFSRMCPKIGQNASAQSTAAGLLTRASVSWHRQIRRKASTGTLIWNLQLREDINGPGRNAWDRKNRGSSVLHLTTPIAVQPAAIIVRAAGSSWRLVGRIPVTIELNCGRFATVA
jgi:hypothetical protein